MPQVAPYSPVPYSAVPYSALPYSAAPYSAVPSPAPQARPTSHHDTGSWSRAPQPVAPPYRDEAKPPYRDDSRDERSRVRDGWSREGHDGRDTGARYRDDLYSTGSHTGPLYPASAVPYPGSHGDGYDQPAEAPQPNYPDSWGWSPESAPRTQQQHRPVSPRDRFSSR